MTTVTIIGNTCSDGELRFTPAGKAVFNFSVAVNERRKDGSEWVDDGATFYDCAAWGPLAENCAESIAEKGCRVIVVGRLRTRTYQNREGQDVTRLSVDVDEVGPSLRWATAQVRKTTKTGGQSQNDPWAKTHHDQRQSEQPPF